MKNACNDNDELSFITLSAATKNVTRYLIPKDKDGAVVSGDGKPSDSENEQREETERADIQRRMLDILYMENTLRRKSRK